MFQILTSFLILLNPILGLVSSSQTPLAKDTFQETSFTNAADYQLPISGQIFLASQLLPMYPIRNWNTPDPEITAKTALVFDATRQKILWQKNGLDEARPIASITKLMTALVISDLVISENTKMDDIFIVSKEAVETYGEMGNLKVGEQLTIQSLLYALLLESSNDAAETLRENLKNIYNKDLIELMNRKTKELNLQNTFYVDSSGLDPENQSSAKDLTKIMQEVLKNQTLKEIIKSSAIDIISADGLFKHHFANTNKLLQRFPELLGGKTGYTEEAGNCMITAFEAPANQGIIISVIMDSQDRISESASLINWTKSAFLW